VSESSSGAPPDTAVTSGEQSALATEPASGSASDTESSESQVTTQLVPLAVNSEAVSAAPSPIAQPVAEPVTSTAVNQVEAATEAAGEGLRLTASRRTWVEVRNQSGVALISRILAVGETFEASEGAPWSVILGNAQGVVLTRSGQAVDLSAQTRGNVARLQVE
jgi:cytoskeleton protein RodZ